MEKKMKHKDVIKLVKRNESRDFFVGLQHLFKKNSETILIGGIIALVILIAVPIYLSVKEKNNVKAEQAVSEANYYLNRPVLDDPQASMYGFFRTKKEKFEKAQAAFLDVLQSYKGSDSEPVATLGIANAFYGNGQYKEALEYYNTYVSKWPKSDLVSEAVSGKGYALYQLGQYGDAVKEWENVMKNYKGGNNPDDVKLRIADSYFKAGNIVAAKAVYEEMIKSGKENFWTSAAKDMLSRIK